MAGSVPDREVREHRVDCGSVTLSVRDHPGGEPAIVALHGLASNARWWELVAGRLVPAHRVVAVDQRGHGRSDRPATGYGFDEAAGDVAALVSALDLGPVIVAGHSWGASVALRYTADHPEAVLGCICVDGGVSDLREYFGRTWEVAGPAMRPPRMTGLTAESLARRLRRSVLSEGSDPATAAWIMMGNFEETESGTLLPRLSLERHMEIAHALYHLDRDALLRRIGERTLLIMARHPGPHTASREEALAGALAVLGPLGRSEWVDGQHDLPVQRPAALAAAVSRNLGWLLG